MSTRKPVLPPAGHIAIATSVTTALAGQRLEDIEALPAKVRDSLTYLAEVSEVAEAVRTEQPAALATYRDDAIALLLAQFPATLDTGLTDDEQAERTVDALFSSHLMARLLADVAAGNVEPVATATKSPKPTTKPATAEPKTTTKPARKKAAAKPSPKPVEQPAAPPALTAGFPDDVPDPFAETGPSDTDPFAEPDESVPVPAGWRRTPAPDEDDF